MTIRDVDRRGTAYALKGVLAISSFRQAIGAAPLPGSLRDSPDIFGQTAATTLCLGCLISILGIWWQSRRSIDGDNRRRLDGIVIEQIGLSGLFVGCTLYVIALLTSSTPTNAAFASGLSLGLAAAAAWQYRELRRYRNRILTPPDVD